MLIVVALCFAVPFAKRNDFDDLIDALNALIAQEGPVPGSIAEKLPEDLDPEAANAFAFEGGQTGTHEDAGENISEVNLQDPPVPEPEDFIDVPTGAKPSPLFNAAPFSQQMLRFEEFGPVPLGPSASVVAGHAMLLQWDIENPGQVRVMPTPTPTWDGVGYVPSFALPTFRSGDLDAAEDAAEDPDFGGGSRINQYSTRQVRGVAI